MNKKFPASLDKLYEMLNFIKEFAIGHGYTQSSICSIELAAEEALVNIISYGYPKEAGVIEIECHEKQGIGLQITLKDNGIPYDPLQNVKEIDQNISVEDRKIGGYGIFFILNIMDKVDYERTDNYNILKMLKKCEQKKLPTPEM